MRLFLLPISTRRSLIYCQRLNNQLSSEITFADKVTTRASNTWLRWERAERGWQKKITLYGNKLFERIPHEEWGLKSIPPLSSRRKDEELKGKKQVEVVFPGSLIGEEKVKTALQAFAGEKRQGFHTKWMWASIIAMPFSAPLALIPVYGVPPNWTCRQSLMNLEYLIFRSSIWFSGLGRIGKVRAVAV